MYSSLPLLTRLRRRLIGVRWLFALLIVLKLAMGTVCLADDGASAESVQVTSAVEVSQAAITDALDASCWHDGASGCHCNCAHAMPLASVVQTTLLPLPPVHAFAVMLTTLQPSPPQNPLRPPIS